MRRAATAPAEALNTKPSLAGFGQHEGAESAHWGDSKLQIVDGTHVVVYSALGSHANVAKEHEDQGAEKTDVLPVERPSTTAASAG